MNETGNLLTWGVIAFLGYFLLKGSAVQRLQFVIRSADVEFTGVLQPVINLKIGIQNPTSQSFTVNNIIGVLAINGQAIANVSAFVQTVILPNAETPYYIQINPNVASLASDVINILQGNSDKSVSINLTGTVNAENVNFPLNITYQLV